MTTQEYTVVNSTEQVWCDSDDRYILIIRQNNEIVGLNFCQGNDFEVFTRDFSSIDQDLTDYYNSVSNYLTGVSEYDRINQAMWGYLEYRILRDSQSAR
jgi:hypothetical protein